MMVSVEAAAAAPATALRDARTSAVGSFIAMILSSGGVIVAAFSLFILPLVKEFGWSRSEVSLAFSISVLVSAISYPAVGWLMDRYGVKQIVLLSILGLAACFGALSLTGSLTGFYIVFLVMGLFGPGQSPMPYAKIVSGWFDRNRGVVLGVVMAGSGISFALLPLYLGHLMAAHGWRGAYVGLGGAVLVVPTLAVGLLVRNPPGSTEAQNSDFSAVAGLSLAESARTYAFWAIGIAVFGITVAVVGVEAHLVPLLTDHGIAPGATSSLLFSLGIGSIVGRVAAGILFDRFHGPFVAAAVFAIATAGVGLLLSGASGWAPWVAVICLGFAHGGETDAIGYLASRYFGLKRFGVINGCYFSIFAVASALGPFIMGKAFDMRHNYDIALWAFIPGMVVTICLILNLGPYRFAQR